MSDIFANIRHLNLLRPGIDLAFFNVRFSPFLCVRFVTFPLFMNSENSGFSYHDSFGSNTILLPWFGSGLEWSFSSNGILSGIPFGKALHLEKP